MTDRQLGQAELMRHRPVRLPAPRLGFARFRFPPDVILMAVRWHLRYCLSYRDIEELLAERGIQVDHVSVYRWVQRFTPLLAKRHAPADMFPVIGGSWTRRHGRARVSLPES